MAAGTLSEVRPEQTIAQAPDPDAQLLGTLPHARVGNTPLLRLPKLTRHLPFIQLLAKS